MSYCYAHEKPAVLTDEGQREFLKVRDFVQRALNLAGAVRAQEAMCLTSGGDSFVMMAYVDRLVELRELREVTPPGIPWQYRVFVRNHDKRL